MAPLDLPGDYLEFLATGRQLNFDPEESDTGWVKLLPLEKLHRELFPVYVCDEYREHIEIADPHRGENGYYLVDGVSLIGECQHYDPCGILMWLPLERCFGSWDQEHSYMCAFGPENHWSTIVGTAPRFLSAQWDSLFFGDSPAMLLVPWPKYRFSRNIGCGPFPYQAI